MNWLEEKLPEFAKQRIVLEDEKEIPYGVQLTLRRGELKLPVNVYWSKKKKGLSVVLGGKKDNPLREAVNGILHQHSESSLHNWKSWIGSDESGKGDFFGPAGRLRVQRRSADAEEFTGLSAGRLQEDQ